LLRRCLICLFSMALGNIWATSDLPYHALLIASPRRRIVEGESWDFVRQPSADDRVGKLQAKVGELWVLIGILLARSGLDAPGIERAHVYAETTWKELVEEQAKRMSDKFLATPEGQEVRRQMLADQRERARQFWREDSVTAGRILPDRSADMPKGDA
jgi:hypothetical protein